MSIYSQLQASQGNSACRGSRPRAWVNIRVGLGHLRGLSTSWRIHFQVWAIVTVQEAIFRQHMNGCFDFFFAAMPRQLNRKRRQKHLHAAHSQKLHVTTISQIINKSLKIHITTHYSAIAPSLENCRSPFWTKIACSTNFIWVNSILFGTLSFILKIYWKNYQCYMCDTRFLLICYRIYHFYLLTHSEQLESFQLYWIL